MLPHIGHSISTKSECDKDLCYDFYRSPWHDWDENPCCFKSETIDNIAYDETWGKGGRKYKGGAKLFMSAWWSEIYEERLPTLREFTVSAT